MGRLSQPRTKHRAFTSIESHMFKYLLDQCVPRPLAMAIATWNGTDPSAAIDVVSVGETIELPYGALDPDILLWAERNGRVVVTTDYSTMPGHFKAHLAAGRHLAGLLMIRPGATFPQLVESLVIIAFAGIADDSFDTIMYIPI
jgi:hypothetical protein